MDIARRDGEGFVLTTASYVDKERRGLRVAADLVAATLAETGQSLGERLRQQFARLLVVFEAWRSTAEAIAAGYTPDDDLEWLTELV